MTLRNWRTISLGLAVAILLLLTIFWYRQRYYYLNIQVPRTSQRCLTAIDEPTSQRLSTALCLTDAEQVYFKRFGIDINWHGYRCPPKHLKRLGRELDGGKWLCLEHSMDVVYSLGSYLELSFESSMRDTYQSNISTFDCFVSPSKGVIPTWLTFRPWCLGERNELRLIDGTEKQFYTLAHIMEELGHKNVDLLKMDIEGSEYEVVRTFKNLPKLPKQIVFELHEMIWKYKHSERLHLWSTLNSLGYKIFQYEPNYKYGKNTAEFSVILAP